MNSFEVFPTSLSDLYLLSSRQIQDARGNFSRIFCAEELSNCGWSSSIEQINFSVTFEKGSVRGMHFQLPPHAEMKMIRCLDGIVWDVAVDLRPESKTFLAWHAEVLSSENRKAMFIPMGFAHGYQALSDRVELIYCHSAAYAPNFEGGINPLDPLLNIKWPLPVKNLSEKDRNYLYLDANFKGVVL